jgi:hypothetical protein
MLNIEEKMLLNSVLTAREFRGMSTIKEMKTLISLYIKDLKGVKVDIGNINPIGKFEKACTIAYNHYVGV